MLGQSLTSTSNHLWLEFNSDQEDTAGGFKLIYSSKISGFLWHCLLSHDHRQWLKSNTCKAIQCCNDRRRFIERWEDLMLPVSSRVFSQHQQAWQNVNFQRCVCATRPNTCNSEWDHCAVSQSFCQNLIPHTQRNVLSQLKFISRLISSFQCQLELCNFPGALKRTAHPLHLSFNLSLHTH